MENNNNKKEKKNRIIDLRRFMEPEMVKPDPNGSYTDMPSEYYDNGVLEEPVQDADDL